MKDNSLLLFDFCHRMRRKREVADSMYLIVIVNVLKINFHLAGNKMND